jgi:hypothetical protein
MICTEVFYSMSDSCIECEGGRVRYPSTAINPILCGFYSGSGYIIGGSQGSGITLLNQLLIRLHPLRNITLIPFTRHPVVEYGI